MAKFRSQVSFRGPFGNPSPTLKMIDFQIILMLYVLRSVKHARQSGRFRKICLLVHLANIFQL